MKKTILALLLVMSMMLGLVGLAEAPGMTPGVYTGIGKGLNGDVEVEVEVDAGSILSVKVTKHQETPQISDPAIEQVPAAIVQYQTVGVDTVTNATVTSQAIIDAAKTALLEAGAEEADITKPAEKEAVVAGEKKTGEYEIIIIGAGGAGMSAAYEAKKAGANVIVLEKTGQVGGNTLMAGSAMNAADEALQKEYTMGQSEIDKIMEMVNLEPKNDLMKAWQDVVRQDMEKYVADQATYLYDSPALHKLQTYVGGDYVAKAELLEIFGNEALNSANWLAENGATWKPGVTTAVGATWMRSHNPTLDMGTAGSAFVLPQSNHYKELGGEVLFDHKAEELVKNDEGRVVGVKGTMSDGTPFEYTASKAVMIATGGFGANVEMRQKYNKHWADLGENVGTTNVATATGDGIVLGEAAGANLIGMEWIQMIPTSNDSFTAGINNAIFTNLEGERFIREDGRRDELSAAILEQPGQRFFKIVDTHTTVDELGGVTYKGVSIEDRVKEEYVAYGETLEELAKDAGMDAAKLIAAVEQYNKAVEEKQDPLGRQLFDQKIDRGPFYAILGEVKVHHTMGGLEINEKTQVLDTQGQVMPGLYAAGEVTGGIHGSNRLGGNAITDVVTFGRIAGQEMVKE